MVALYEVEHAVFKIEFKHRQSQLGMKIENT